MSEMEINKGILKPVNIHEMCESVALMNNYDQEILSSWKLASEETPNESCLCVFHIPLKGFPDYTVTGFLDYSDGTVLDPCGGDFGYTFSDVAQWVYLTLPEAV